MSEATADKSENTPEAAQPNTRKADFYIQVGQSRIDFQTALQILQKGRGGDRNKLSQPKNGISAVYLWDEAEKETLTTAFQKANIPWGWAPDSIPSGHSP